jgi:colicin import membrane protein
MRTGLVISGGAHAVVLLWCVVTFVIRPNHVETPEAVPVDVVSTSDISQMTAGTKSAPPTEKAKPVADKIGAPTPVDDPLAKLANKEIKAATDVPPPPERKPPEPKPKKPPAAQADPIADALKKDEEKKPEPKKTEVKPPPPQSPKKPAPESPAFDSRQVQDLLNKHSSQRVASAGREINNTPTFGDARGSDAQLSADETAAFRARLHLHWTVPPHDADSSSQPLEVEIYLNRDGTLAAPPALLTQGNSPKFMAAWRAARTAVYEGQPYTMFKPEHYEQWKDVIATFDPKDLPY